MSQPEWFLLPCVAEVHHIPNVMYQFGEVGLALAFKKTFQLRRRIEMVFDRVLAPARDDDDVVDPGSDAFLDHVLNQWLINHGQHFLGLRLGCGQESSAKPGGRQDGFPNALWLQGHRFCPQVTLRGVLARCQSIG